MSKKRHNPHVEVLEYGTDAPDFERSLAQKMMDERRARRYALLLHRHRQIEDTTRTLASAGLNQQADNKDGTSVRDYVCPG
jgi:hypothetical protein